MHPVMDADAIRAATSPRVRKALIPCILFGSGSSNWGGVRMYPSPRLILLDAHPPHLVPSELSLRMVLVFENKPLALRVKAEVGAPFPPERLQLCRPFGWIAAEAAEGRDVEVLSQQVLRVAKDAFEAAALEREVQEPVPGRASCSAFRSNLPPTRPPGIIIVGWTRVCVASL